MIDVIVLDLDGTLLKKDKTVSSETLQVLMACEQLGKQIVIATARPPRLGGVSLPEELQREYMIYYNGAEIHHHKHIIYQQYISVHSMEAIAKLLLGTSERPVARVCYEINDRLYSNFDISTFFGVIPFTPMDLEQFTHVPAAKILIDMESIPGATWLSDKLPSDCSLVVTDNGTLGQVMASGVNKLSGLQQILHQLGTSLDHVIFFGDDLNDLELLKASGIGVAMGNAADEVKLAADFVTSSNEENGIGEFLRGLWGVEL